MTELNDLKQRIRAGVEKHYETKEGKAHKKKLSKAMKKRWRELKGKEHGNSRFRKKAGKKGMEL